jgi:hypothetical protein
MIFLNPILFAHLASGIYLSNRLNGLNGLAHLCMYCRRRRNKRYDSTSLLAVTWQLIYVQGLCRDVKDTPNGFDRQPGV